MPSDNQKRQLDLARAQAREAQSQSVERGYEGRDPETGLSLLRTAAGSVLPAIIEGTAQPFFGESIFTAQGRDLGYGFGRSVEPVVPTPVFTPDVLRSERVAVLFVKNGLTLPSLELPHEVRCNARYGPPGFETGSDSYIRGSEAGESLAGTLNWSSGAPQWSGTAVSNNALITGPGTIAETRMDKQVGGAPFSAQADVQILWYLDPSITKGTINWTLTVTNAGSPGNAPGRAGLHYDTGPASLPVFGINSPVLQDEQSFSDDLTVTVNSTFDFSASAIGNSRVLSIWAGWNPQSQLQLTEVSIRINSVTWDHDLGELWIGGDRPVPIKLRDLDYGSFVRSGGQSYYMSAKSPTVFTWFSEWQSQSNINGTYYEIPVSGDTVTSTDYTEVDTPTGSVEDWRTPLLDMDIRPSEVPDFGAITDSCVAAYIQPVVLDFNTSNNIIEDTRYFWDPNQLISGIGAGTRLLNGESIENSVTEVNTLDGSGVSCSETPQEDLTVPIVYSLKEPSEEISRILAYIPYFI